MPQTKGMRKSIGHTIFPGSSSGRIPLIMQNGYKRAIVKSENSKYFRRRSRKYSFMNVQVNFIQKWYRFSSSLSRAVEAQFRSQKTQMIGGI